MGLVLLRAGDAGEDHGDGPGRTTHVPCRHVEPARLLHRRRGVRYHRIGCVLTYLLVYLLTTTADRFPDQGPDLQNILRQSYDYLTITPKLRSTYDRCLISKTYFKERMAFLGYNSLAKS